MTETLLAMILGALLFGGGATWGAWVTMRIRDKETPIPFAPVERGGVAYDDEGDDETEDDSHTGYATL